MKINRVYRINEKKHQSDEKRVKKALIAFLSGGVFGALCEGIHILLTKQLFIDDSVASNYIILGVIILTSLLTGIGIYDKLAQQCGAGLFVPISGFANALTSSALEHKCEGLIYGIGSNMFKLAGSVITYGIVSVYILGLVRYFTGI